MDSTVAKENFCLLQNLVPHVKLREIGGKLFLEDRYLPSVRRAFSNDSRTSLLPLVRQTILLAPEKKNDKEKLVTHLRAVMAETYPKHIEFNHLFDELSLLIAQQSDHVKVEKIENKEISTLMDEPLNEEIDERDDVLHDVLHDVSSDVSNDDQKIDFFAWEEGAQFLNLRNLNFQKSKENTISATHGLYGLTVCTKESRNGYLLSSRPIPVKNLSQLHVLFTAEIHRGGFGIGLLDSKGIWIRQCCQNFPRKGYLEGSICLESPDCDEVMIVFYNCCSPANKSEFIIKDVECHAILPDNKHK
jgi:hypothetical protein